MRSIGRCYSEHAIKVADSYCSGPLDRGVYVSDKRNQGRLSGRYSVSSRYRARLCSGEKFLISITWSSPGEGFSISISGWEEDDHREIPDSSSSWFGNSMVIEKVKGSEMIESRGSMVEVSWDLSGASYDVDGPEPIGGFYVVVKIDYEIALFLGDGQDPLRESRDHLQGSRDQALVSRCECFAPGSRVFSTRVRFSESGTDHDIVIRCSREGGKGSKNWAMSVSVDKRIDLIQVKRLEWNFRGNQTIFLDGKVVDMMWDVHGWLFKEKCESGCAIFMFKTRSGLESRLWLDDKKKKKSLEKKKTEDNEDNIGFCLLISACKSPD